MLVCLVNFLFSPGPNSYVLQPAKQVRLKPSVGDVTDAIRYVDAATEYRHISTVDSQENV